MSATFNAICSADVPVFVAATYLPSSCKYSEILSSNSLVKDPMPNQPAFSASLMCSFTSSSIYGTKTGIFSIIFVLFLLSFKLLHFLTYYPIIKVFLQQDVYFSVYI